MGKIKIILQISTKNGRNRANGQARKGFGQYHIRDDKSSPTRRQITKQNQQLAQF